LQERLLRRGREDAAASAERLQRGAALDVAAPNLVTIVNDGPIEEAADALVRLLATFRRSPAGRRQAGIAPAR